MKPLSKKGFEVFLHPRLTMGERFKDARIVHNRHGKQTIKEVATSLGITQSALSEIENDKRNPGAETVKLLAQHYGVTADFLLGLSDTKTPDTTVQAIIDYTGLTERNVEFLHNLKGIERKGYDYGVSRKVHGAGVFTDCANDLLDCLYDSSYDVSGEYLRIRIYQASTLDHSICIDGDKLSEELNEIDAKLSQYGFTTIFAQNAGRYASAQIGNEIAEYFRKKYANSTRLEIGMKEDSNGHH